MLANYGYRDASGEYYITINTDLCNGCGECVPVCPAGLFEVLEEDPFDPEREEPVAVVKEENRKKLKYDCAPCKPAHGLKDLPCLLACERGAITHSW